MARTFTAPVKEAPVDAELVQIARAAELAAEYPDAIVALKVKRTYKVYGEKAKVLHDIVGGNGYFSRLDGDKLEQKFMLSAKVLEDKLIELMAANITIAIVEELDGIYRVIKVHSPEPLPEAEMNVDPVHESEVPLEVQQPKGLNFRCDRDRLLKHLDCSGRAVAKYATHPILLCVLIAADAKTSMITTTGYNLNLGIKTKFPATVRCSGSVAIPAVLLRSLIAKIPKEEDVEVSVDLDSGEAIVAAVSGRFRINAFGADEFPEFPIIPETLEPVELHSQVLIDASDRTLFSASGDETKRILCGVHFQIGKKWLEAASTDGHRLSVYKRISEETGDLDLVTELTVPATGLAEICRMTREFERESIKLFFVGGKDETNLLDCTSAIAQIDANCTVVSRLIDGNYPNYQQLLPTAFEIIVTIEKELLISTLERVNIFAIPSKEVVRLSIEENSMTLAAMHDGVGDGKESIPVVLDGKAIAIAFNSLYLLEALRAMPGNTIKLLIDSKTSPALIVPTAETNYTHLLMPIQIRD